MRQIRTILVPVDFSDHSERALQLGIDFAERFGATLYLFHAFSPRVSAVGISDFSGSCALGTELRVAAAERLSEVVARAQSLGIKVRGEVGEGPPYSAIREEVDRLKPDLLVMATRGRRGRLKHVILRNVAERTIRSVSCPVITVHNNGS